MFFAHLLPRGVRQNFKGRKEFNNERKTERENKDNVYLLKQRFLW